jgi:hypothetical protein
VKRFVAVDPGYGASGGTGLAYFEDGELAAAWLARGRDACTVANDAWRILTEALPVDVLAGLGVVAEVPVVRRRGARERAAALSGTLIQLALVSGMIAGRAAPGTQVQFVIPEDWKGQLPKDVCVRRVKEVLSGEELDRMDLPSRALQHNVFDAAGVGLWRLGRLRC